MTRKCSRLFLQRASEAADSVTVSHPRVVVRIKDDSAAPRIEPTDDGGAWVSAWFYITAAEIEMESARAAALTLANQRQRDHERAIAAALARSR